MSPSKISIAVLDDEPAMRKGLRRLLTGRGFSVTEYERGTDFIAAMDSRPLNCLVLDLHMPELDGFKVLEILRSRSSRVPVVVLTALEGPGIAERVRSLGAYAFLKKPVEQDTLFAAIQSAFNAPGSGR